MERPDQRWRTVARRLEFWAVAGLILMSVAAGILNLAAWILGKS